MVTPELLTAVVGVVRSTLEPLAGLDWSVPAHELEWSCARTVVHLADSFFAEAAQLASRRTADWLPAEVVSSAEPLGLLDAVEACSLLLVSVASSRDPATRAWHPWGTADPEGWLAMGCAEGLVHTWDVARALGAAYVPPASLAAPVVARLFPSAPSGDAGEVLLWCLGRVALPGHERQAEWRWWSAPREDT